MRSGLLLVGVAATLIWVAVGCGESDLGTKGDLSGKTVEAQLKEIDDNPNMPPQAKAIAKAQIQAHSGSGATKGP